MPNTKHHKRHNKEVTNRHRNVMQPYYNATGYSYQPGYPRTFFGHNFYAMNPSPNRPYIPNQSFIASPYNNGDVPDNQAWARKTDEDRFYAYGSVARDLVSRLQTYFPDNKSKDNIRTSPSARIQDLQKIFM